MMSDRLSDLTNVLQNIRPHVGVQMPLPMRLAGVSPTTLPQAIENMRNVQTSLDWVLHKQVCC